MCSGNAAPINRVGKCRGRPFGTSNRSVPNQPLYERNALEIGVSDDVEASRCHRKYGNCLWLGSLRIGVEPLMLTGPEIESITLNCRAGRIAQLVRALP